MYSASRVVGLFALASGTERHGSKVAVLYENVSSVTVEDAFRHAYQHFARSFDYDLYGRLAADFEAGLVRYNQTTLARADVGGHVVPHCDKGVVRADVAHVTGMAVFPGGAVGSVFGFDLGRRLYELSEHVAGPTSASLVAPMALSSQALSTGMNLVQSAVAAMVHVVPPLVPPPAWNNQPLSCAPMVSGHNCFGSVRHPITMADLMLADVTDAMLDGYVAGFPTLYARKVGKTSDGMYKSCFASYMSMMCSSVFPRCTAPQSRDELVPVGGSAPACLHMCVLPLVMCPGFWISDLLDSCSTVSVPPMCTQVSFTNVARAPPQYASYDEASPFPAKCPEAALSSLGDEDLLLYEVGAGQASPIERAARSVTRVAGHGL